MNLKNKIYNYFHYHWGYKARPSRVMAEPLGDIKIFKYNNKRGVKMDVEKTVEILKSMRDNLKMDLEDTQTTTWTDNETTYKKRVELLQESIEALDNAIASVYYADCY